MTNAEMTNLQIAEQYFERAQEVDEHGMTVVAELYERRAILHYVRHIAYRLEAAQGVTPQPDWSQAPEWAQWWTIDADGEISYWQDEPALERWTAMWYIEGEVWAPDEEKFVDLPIGLDWRVLKVKRRPAEQGQGGE